MTRVAITVMAGLDPATHAVTLRMHAQQVRSGAAWMPGSSPGMTDLGVQL